MSIAELRLLTEMWALEEECGNNLACLREGARRRYYELEERLEAIEKRLKSDTIPQTGDMENETGNRQEALV